MFTKQHTLKLALLLVLFAGMHQFAVAQSGEVCYNPNLVKDTSKRSIKSMAFAKHHGDSIKIAYHSPGVRNRIIWGGLVPFGDVWVTGAHDATTLELPAQFVMGGKTIPAGKYAIFTIPGKTEWTFILNKHWQQHLASEYDQKDDIVRIQVKPKKHAHTERLQYSIVAPKAGQSAIVIAWEKLELTVPFSIK
ncbi:DUF2911 domain-containing protein [Pseudoflavitalea sp. G-6-1-2]|uniref:DUF2911 domain-containing protein n=1 Tax=Pseudoflavitalea sp. G-6-1-2 TaxID=2728841 RepID=UPI00146F4E16|nr:DUF2911 domain-containing protein [Pseudoflavitalea sp. G-6-1-2]NML21357.1 DUF2911 domain-containing protein [Pseudoflavitalea sp. G-6-1-2]